VRLPEENAGCCVWHLPAGSSFSIAEVSSWSLRKGREGKGRKKGRIWEVSQREPRRAFRRHGGLNAWLYVRLIASAL
jgi:hypothetical protein